MPVHSTEFYETVQGLRLFHAESENLGVMGTPGNSVKYNLDKCYDRDYCVIVLKPFNLYMHINFCYGYSRRFALKIYLSLGVICRSCFL